MKACIETTASAPPLPGAEETRAIPRLLQGVDRQERVGEIVASLEESARNHLVVYMEERMEKMLSIGASDMDLGGEGCAHRIWYRVAGRKVADMEGPVLSFEDGDLLIHSLLTEKQQGHLLSERNVDFSYTLELDGVRHRLRADAYFDLGHLALNMRLIPGGIRPLQELGFHFRAMERFNIQREKRGLVLVTGITGSGKSSTLDSIVDANNRIADSHVTIIASPIETIHEPRRCIIRHREVGRDVRSFKEGTVQALRQDPDIVVIGEMRDPDTIMTALEITDSGHKVFSTLHTSSAAESVDRIIGEVPAVEQERVRLRLGDVLSCVVSQKLVPVIGGGRVLAKEVLVVTSSVRAAIKNNNIGEVYQMIMESRDDGMITLEQDLHRLVGVGRIRPEVARDFANNKRRMEALLNG
ncbi:MAG: twitching motility protein PilT [Gemmatimonadetes bacterium]|nr:twitching motility protein PilT [Gemmatimonadota bacterium]